MLKNLVLGAMGSIGTKMGLVLLAMAGTTGFVAFVAIDIFNRTGDNLSKLVSDRLPEVSISAQVLSEANTLTTAVFEMLAADNPTEVETAHVAATGALERLSAAAERADSTEINGITAEVEAISAGLGNTKTALKSALLAQSTLEGRTLELRQTANGLVELILKEIRAAENFLKAASRRTQRDASANIDALMAGQIALINDVYRANALVNQLAGYGLALTREQDLRTRGELRNTISERLPALRDATAGIEAFDTDYIDTDLLNGFLTDFETLALPGSAINDDLFSDIQNARDRVAAHLDAATESLNTSAKSEAEAAVSSGNAKIKDLLEGAVARASTLHSVESAVEQFLAGTLEIAQSKTPEDLEEAQRQIGQLRQKLRLLGRRVVQLEAREAEAISGQINILMAFADPDTGIGREAENAIVTLKMAVDDSAGVRGVVDTLLERSFSAGRSIVGNISAEANVLRAEATDAAGEMKSIVALSAFLLLASVFLTLRWILLPIRRITKTTHRLAEGNLNEVTGFERAGGEIAAMGRALQVFRNSLVENKERVAKEAERQATEQQAEQERLRQEQEAQRLEDEAARKAAEEKERVRAEREEERAEAQRQREQKAQALAAEQRIIVTNLADGLQRLASGDLKVQINTVFPEAYEQLRIDFNQTVLRLSEVVSQIASSESSINASCKTIASRTDQLAQRTKKAADTLADTSQSLGIMTDQVQATSDRASSALRLVNGAHECSERGRNIVSDTVDAMADIEDYSSKVAKITNVIDEIAFQTNLLALNAGVEAARAGESGRGFAVVASEVRELALRSSNAAGEINSLITESTAKVEEGSRLVAETRTSLGEIDAAVNALAVEAGEIAAASKDQAAQIASINASVNELDKMTKENSVMSSETQRENQSMLLDSKSLADTVSSFTLDASTKPFSPDAKVA